MTVPPPAIVVGVDSPIGLTVMRELGGHGVPVHGVGAAGAIGRASRHCARFHQRPPGALADWLPALIRETGAGALFATSETDLMQLAGLPERIDGCRVLTPRAGPLAQVLDKRRTLAVAQGLGLSVPASWQPARDDDRAGFSAALDYPVIAKWADPAVIRPRLTEAGLRFHKAEFVPDARTLLAVLGRYDAFGQWPLIQSWCPGTGLGQMVHMEDGEPTLLFQHRRLHEWPPEGGVSTLCEAVPLGEHTAQMALSVALLRAIRWQGPAMVEYRFDPATGRYWLMEVNGRFWGSLPLAAHSGAFFAWEQYRRAVLGHTAPAPAPRAGLRARYMVPETRRLGRLLFGRTPVAVPDPRRQRAGTLARYLLGFVDPRTRYYVMSVRDPGPVISDLLAIARKLPSRGKPRPD